MMRKEEQQSYPSWVLKRIRHQTLNGKTLTGVNWFDGISALDGESTKSRRIPSYNFFKTPQIFVALVSECAARDVASVDERGWSKSFPDKYPLLTQSTCNQSQLWARIMIETPTLHQPTRRVFNSVLSARTRKDRRSDWCLTFSSEDLTDKCGDPHGRSTIFSEFYPDKRGSYKRMLILGQDGGHRDDVQWSIVSPQNSFQCWELRWPEGPGRSIAANLNAGFFRSLYRQPYASFVNVQAGNRLGED
ncbi:hypothetical protein C8R47DRAFT_1080072 [Mycena vitilis]|nr:hypothetical protein C8R47DRAFT_1080072 [Mycena vitilis]